MARLVRESTTGIFCPRAALPGWRTQSTPPYAATSLSGQLAEVGSCSEGRARAVAIKREKAVVNLILTAVRGVGCGLVSEVRRYFCLETRA